MEQLKTVTKEDFRSASESGESNGNSVFKVRREILQETQGDVSLLQYIFTIYTLAPCLDYSSRM